MAKQKRKIAAAAAGAVLAGWWVLWVGLAAGVTVLWTARLGEVDAMTQDAGRSVKVAMCQIVSLDGDREGNFVRIENAIREAAGRGAQIACLPETCLLGWVNPEAHERALPIPGEDTERLGRLAAKYGVYVCAGLAEKEGEKLYDSAVLVDPRGKLLLVHRKINTLTQLMTPPYARGEAVKAVDTELGRIGILICADTFHSGVLERMQEEQPELLLVPYGWAAPEERWPGHGKELEKTVAAAARYVGCALIGTDLVGAITHGPWTGQIYGGQSVAADAEGNILARGADRDREVVVFAVPIGAKAK